MHFQYKQKCILLPIIWWTFPAALFIRDIYLIFSHAIPSMIRQEIDKHKNPSTYYNNYPAFCKHEVFISLACALAFLSFYVFTIIFYRSVKKSINHKMNKKQMSYVNFWFNFNTNQSLFYAKITLFQCFWLNFNYFFFIISSIWITFKQKVFGKQPFLE